MEPLAEHNPQSVGDESVGRSGQVEPRRGPASARVDNVKIPISVMVISVIEIALGVLEIGRAHV